MNGTKQVGLRLILRDMAFMNAVMPETAARDLIRKWLDGSLAGTVIGDPSAPIPWGTRVDSIMGMHTFELEQQPVQQQVAPGTLTFGGASKFGRS